MINPAKLSQAEQKSWENHENTFLYDHHDFTDADIRNTFRQGFLAAVRYINNLERYDSQ